MKFVLEEEDSKGKYYCGKDWERCKTTSDITQAVIFTATQSTNGLSTMDVEPLMPDGRWVPMAVTVRMSVETF